MIAPLEARGVGVTYRGSRHQALRDANLRIEPGAALGIVGESGSGKTTLARVLVGALRPTTGTVSVCGTPWEKVKRRDRLRSAVQMVFQDPYDSLNPYLTAVAAVAEPFRVWACCSPAEARTRATRLLGEVGIVGDLIEKRPAGLSGGQRQRVGIARALACEPAVLVADEPTSSLDVSVQAQILNLLADLRVRHSLALVLVSHDLAVIRHMTSDTVVMFGGSIVERGSTEELFHTPQHPYTAALLDSAPSSGNLFTREERPSADASSEGCVYAERCTRLQPNCVSEHPVLLRSGEREVVCNYPLGTSRTYQAISENGKGSDLCS